MYVCVPAGSYMRWWGHDGVGGDMKVLAVL